MNLNPILFFDRHNMLSSTFLNMNFPKFFPAYFLSMANLPILIAGISLFVTNEIYFFFNFIYNILIINTLSLMTSFNMDTKHVISPSPIANWVMLRSIFCGFRTTFLRKSVKSSDVHSNLDRSYSSVNISKCKFSLICSEST